MKLNQRFSCYIGFLLAILTSACAPVKTLEVWQDETYTQPLQKVLVMVVHQQGKIRNQFENLFSEQLTKRGVEAIPSHKVLPQLISKLDREAVLAEVKELGVSNVLVARSIHRDEITNHQYGGVFFGGTVVYDHGWHTYAYGSFYSKEYDTEHFIIATKLFEMGNEKPVWSDLTQVRVEGSREGAVNLFIPVLIKQLEKSQLLEKLPN